jgi:hypothetical protein
VWCQAERVAERQRQMDEQDAKRKAAMEEKNRVRVVVYFQRYSFSLFELMCGAVYSKLRRNTLSSSADSRSASRLPRLQTPTLLLTFVILL